VELGEIEAALLKIPGVKQGVAIPYVDGSGQKALAAYVVIDKTCRLEPQQLRQALSTSLTSFAVPSRIILLEALPLSPNGKVDRKALPRMDERCTTAGFVPPRTAVEHQMVALWEELLEKRPIGITDDFFALGGHSLLAVTLMSRIRSQFGWDIPLEQLIARPTIEALIAADDETASAREPKRFLVFNAQGSRIPIVLVPGIYGTLFVFRQLPKRFGPEQPVFLATDCSSCEMDGSGEPTVERMAESCEAELLQLCKGGPLILGGLSFGMSIAFELAERLRRKGVEVPLLISLDGMAPGYPEFLPRAQRLMAHLREFTTGDRRRYLLDRVANTKRRFLRLLGREHELSAEVLSASPEVRRIMKRTFTVNIQASRRYRPKFTYSGTMLLFRAERPERWVGIRGLDPLHGWGDFIDGKISVVILPGDHGTILDDTNQDVVVTSVVEHLRTLERRESMTSETRETESETNTELAAVAL
jgi:thioesterase domain-containing protein/aryl carrier-like protein